MSDLGETFFTSVGCMDGRVQTPVSQYGWNKYSAIYPDTITEAGIVGLLANNPSKDFLDSVKKKVLISVEKHHSKGIVVHGHQNCAGNPIDDNIHKDQTKKAAEVIRSFVPSDIEVRAVFVVKKDNNWIVTEL